MLANPKGMALVKLAETSGWLSETKHRKDLSVGRQTLELSLLSDSKQWFEVSKWGSSSRKGGFGREGSALKQSC
jgi:hypothetical protein